MSFNGYISKSLPTNARQEQGSGSGLAAPARPMSNREAFNLVEGSGDRSNDPRCGCGAYLSKYGNPVECAPCERTKRIERAS